MVPTGRIPLLPALVRALVAPVPLGPDGDGDGADADVQEKALRALHAYAVACAAPRGGAERAALGGWLREQGARAGGVGGVAERWGLSEQEVRELMEATA